MVSMVLDILIRPFSACLNSASSLRIAAPLGDEAGFDKLHKDRSMDRMLKVVVGAARDQACCSSYVFVLSLGCYDETWRDLREVEEKKVLALELSQKLKMVDLLVAEAVVFCPSWFSGGECCSNRFVVGECF